MKFTPPSGDLRAWAVKLVNDLNAEASHSSVPQLPYQTGGEKPGTDGLLMWDPATGDFVVSKANTWKKVTLT